MAGLGHKKATLLYTLTILGWALFLGPLLQPYMETAKHQVKRLWIQWQPEEDTSEHSLIPSAPGYTTRIVSYDPFIMHIENFVSAQEREYILEFGYDVSSMTLPFKQDHD